MAAWAELWAGSMLTEVREAVSTEVDAARVDEAPEAAEVMEEISDATEDSAEETAEEVSDWALATAAKTPATTTEKRILLVICTARVDTIRY